MSNYTNGCPYFGGTQTSGVDGNFIRCRRRTDGIRRMPTAMQMSGFVDAYCRNPYSYRVCALYNQNNQVVVTAGTITSGDVVKEGDFCDLLDDIASLWGQKGADAANSPWFCVIVQGQAIFIKDESPCSETCWRLTDEQVVEINKLADGVFRLSD